MSDASGDCLNIRVGCVVRARLSFYPTTTFRVVGVVREFSEFLAVIETESQGWKTVKRDWIEEVLLD